MTLCHTCHKLGYMTTLAASEMTVGQRIKAARKEVGLSQERLARVIGTTRQVVIRWEKDKHLPNELSRKKLGDATGRPARFFREGDPDADEEDDQLRQIAYDFARVLLERARSEPRLREPERVS